MPFSAAPQYRRSKEERAADLLWLERKFLRGTTSSRKLAPLLAAERSYALGWRTIENDLKLLRGQWEEQLGQARKNALANQLSALREIESEIWAAWERSKGESTESNIRKESGGDASSASGTVTSLKKKSNAGDPQFTRQLVEVRKQIAELLGINAPVRAEISGPDGGPIKSESAVSVTVAKTLSNEAVASIMRRFTAAMPAPDPNVQSSN